MKKSFPQNAHSMNPRWRSSDPQPHLWLKILRSLLPSHLPLTQLKAHSLTLTHYCSLTCLLLTSDPLLLTRLSTHSLLPLTHSWHESCLSFLLTHNSLLPHTLASQLTLSRPLNSNIEPSSELRQNGLLFHWNNLDFLQSLTMTNILSNALQWQSDQLRNQEYTVQHIPPHHHH